MQHLKENASFYFLGLLLLANVFIWQTVFAEQRDGVLTVAFLDVGQGDAIFIESPNGNQMLVDGGANRAVLRELSKSMSLRDRSIDVVVATHPDADHIGGLTDVIERYDVKYMLRSGVMNDTGVYRALNAALEERDVPVVLARRGMRVALDENVYFDILFPDRDVSSVEPNAASVVGRLVYGETEFLFTGDAPQSIEKYLVSAGGTDLRSDVLKVGHHGSKTSSSELFVGFVSPNYAVISAGCDNRYGHPHQEVLDTLTQFEMNIISTCEEGAVSFESDGTLLRRR